MLEKMKQLVVEEEGQGLTEYAVILGIVVVIAVGLSATFGDEIKNLFTRIADKIKTIAPTA